MHNRLNHTDLIIIGSLNGIGGKNLLACIDTSDNFLLHLFCCCGILSRPL